MLINIIYLGKHKEVRKLNKLYPEHIERIAGAFENFQQQEGFSVIKSIEDVMKNNGNLNVSLYVSQVIKEEEINIKSVLSEINDVDEQLEEVNGKLNSYLKELGYID